MARPLVGAAYIVAWAGAFAGHLVTVAQRGASALARGPRVGAEGGPNDAVDPCFDP